MPNMDPKDGDNVIDCIDPEAPDCQALLEKGDIEAYNDCMSRVLSTQYMTAAVVTVYRKGNNNDHQKLVIYKCWGNLPPERDRFRAIDTATREAGNLIEQGVAWTPPPGTRLVAIQKTDGVKTRRYLGVVSYWCGDTTNDKKVADRLAGKSEVSNGRSPTTPTDRDNVRRDRHDT